MQASTSALITLIIIALWVLAVVARPYTWWKLLLLGGSVGAYVMLFAWPFTREFFALDPSNVAATTSAFVCGGVGIVLVEVAWTVTGRMYGEHAPPVRPGLLLSERRSRVLEEWSPLDQHCDRSADPAVKPGRGNARALVDSSLARCCFGEELGIAHDLAGRALAERVGVVAADHHLVLAHRVDEQAQGGGVEHHAVDEEAVGVVARRAAPSARAPARRAAARRCRGGRARTGSCRRRGRSTPAATAARRSNTPPRIIASTERCVSAGIPDSQRAIQRSCRGPVGMSHGWTNTGAPTSAQWLQELDDAVVVEVALADVVADLDAGVAGGEAAIELGARRVGILERHLAERDQPVAAVGDALQRQVVEDPRHLDRLAGVRS